MRKKILVSSHPLLIPVVKILAEKHDILTIDKIIYERLKNIDIPCKGLFEFADGDMRMEGYGESAKIIHTSFSPISFDGLGAGPSKFLENGIQGYFQSRINDFVMLTLTLDASDPDLVIMHNDVEGVMRMVALWCQVNDVPCLHVPHAVYQDVDRGVIGSDIHDLVTASHLAVSGWAQRDWYKKRGATNIKETGLPQNDKWDKKKALRLFNLDANRPVITYMTTWHQSTNMLGCTDRADELYGSFLRAMKMFGDDVQLIIKMHPNAFEANINAHVHAAEELGLNCVMSIQYLELALQASDVVFAPYGSNTLIDAAHIPYTRLASFEGQGFLDDDEVVKCGFSEKEIAELIEESLTRPPVDMEAFRYKYAGVPDGKAHVRVASWAEELIQM